jgi:hypothetical protein
MLDQKNNIFKYILSTEMIQNPERREFLKAAGLMGLALAGGAVGLSSLNACAYVDYTRYDFNAIAERYTSNPIQINSIDDFALSGEELGTMRPCKGAEKNRIPYSGENPLKGKSNEYPLQERKGDIPLCEEWLLAENVGQNWVPWYGITIFARKFKSEEESLMVEKNLER